MNSLGKRALAETDIDADEVNTKRLKVGSTGDSYEFPEGSGTNGQGLILTNNVLDWGAVGGGGGPVYDQSLNTTDDVEFVRVATTQLKDPTSTTKVNINSSTVNIVTANLLHNGVPLSNAIYDQSLNTTDAVEFSTVATTQLKDPTQTSKIDLNATTVNINSANLQHNGVTIPTTVYDQSLNTADAVTFSGVTTPDLASTGTLLIQSTDVASIVSYESVVIQSIGGIAINSSLSDNTLRSLNGDVVLQPNGTTGVVRTERNVKIGSTLDNYVLPNTRSTVANGVLKDTLGNGVVEWKEDVAFADQEVNTNSDVTFSITRCSDIRSSAADPNLELSSATGNINLDSSSGDITLSAVGNVNIIGAPTIGFANAYALPSTSLGAGNNDVLKFDTFDSTLKFDQLFNQTLNTGDEAKFSSVKVSDGVVNAPGFQFTNETNTGMYLAEANDMRFTVGGSDALQMNVGNPIVTIPAADALVSQYGNSSGCFSVRKLFTAYVGNCMAVSSIEGTTQIPFDSTGQASYSVFSGLTEPVYISTWYDQSGFGRHLTGEALVGGVLPRLLFETIGTNQRPTIRFNLSRFISSVSSDVFGLSNSDHSYSVLFNTVVPITSVTFLLSNAVEASRNDLSLQGAGSGARCINDASIADIGAPYAYSDANWHVLAGGARSTGFQSSMVRAEGIQVVGSAGGQISTIHPLVIGTRLDFNTQFAFPGDICEVILFDQQWIELSPAWTAYYTNAIEYMQNGISSELLTTSLGSFISPKLIIPPAMGNDFQYQMGGFEGYSVGNLAVTAAGVTPVPVIFDNFTSSFANGFTITTGAVGTSGSVQYNGSRLRRVHGGITISYVSATTNRIVTFYVAKNGVIVLGSRVVMFYDKGADQYASTAIHTMPVLDNGDVLRLYVQADAPADITVTDANFFGMAMANVIV